jgi:hypothetical protein
MSATLTSKSVGETKKFGKGERTIPHPSQKAQKWYPAEDEQQPKKVSIALRGHYTLNDMHLRVHLASSCYWKDIDFRNRNGFGNITCQSHKTSQVIASWVEQSS